MVHTKILCCVRQLSRRNAAILRASVLWCSSYSALEPVPLAYSAYHKGKSSSKDASPPILICHGLFGSKQNWNSLAKAMQKKLPNRIFALDLRNHGDSPHEDSMLLPEMATDVAAMLPEVAPAADSMILIGHSLGGRVAMTLAMKWPHLIHRLIIEDIAPKAFNRSAPSMVMQFLVAMQNLQWPLDMTNLVEARHYADEALKGTVEDITVRQFLLTNVIIDAETGYPGWQCNLEAIAEGVRSMTMGTACQPGEVFRGQTLFMAGGDSPYVSVKGSFKDHHGPCDVARRLRLNEPLSGSQLDPTSDECKDKGKKLAECIKNCVITEAKEGGACHFAFTHPKGNMGHHEGHKEKKDNEEPKKEAKNGKDANASDKSQQ